MYPFSRNNSINPSAPGRCSAPTAMIKPAFPGHPLSGHRHRTDGVAVFTQQRDQSAGARQMQRPDGDDQAAIRQSGFGPFQHPVVALNQAGLLKIVDDLGSQVSQLAIRQAPDPVQIIGR